MKTVTIEDKLQQIRSLEERIFKCRKCLNFEPWEKPYLNRNLSIPVIFVGKHPSTTGRRSGDPDWRKKNWLISTHGPDALFREMREKYGFSGAYLTDLLKCVREVRERPTPSEVINCIEFLKEEIRIIQPILIVAMGRDVEAYLKELLELRCPVFYIYQPSYAYRWKKQGKWEKQFDKLRELYEAIQSNDQRGIIRLMTPQPC